ncbi:hypothetical protein M0P65_03245 [Candidatus Gracilibacteria bacterium]|nr:hypothetical protein [Candidatus Gracilibacteria bacterium]
MTTKFRESFPDKVSVLAVIHADTLEQTISNVKIAVENNLSGVFLINHRINWMELVEIFGKTREEFEKIWMGINLLGHNLYGTINEVGLMQMRGCRVDGIWVDNPEIKGINPGYDNQDIIKKRINYLGWKGLYFGGVAFKYQPEVENLELACAQGQKYLDVTTTSGPGTGEAVNIEKLKKIREFSGDHPIAVASGTNDKNIIDSSEFADIFLVSTHLNKQGDFLNLDPEKVKRMKGVVEKLNGR